MINKIKFLCNGKIWIDICNIFRIISSNKLKVFSFILIALLVISFAFSGIITALTRDNSWVLRIGNEYIGKSEFEKELKILKKSDSTFGIDEIEIKRRLLNKMAIEKTIKYELKNFGITIDDDTVIGIVKRNPNFKDDQEFSTKKFKEFLKQNNINEKDYFGFVKNQLSEKIVFQFIDNFITVDKGTAKIIEKSRKEIRNFDLYTLDEEKIKMNIDVNQEDLSNFYNKNRNLFTKPMELNINYITGNDIKNTIKYTPSISDISKMRKMYPNIKESKLKDLMINSYICQSIENFIKNTSSDSNFNAMIEAYNIKLKSKNIILNKENLKYSNLENANIGDIKIIHKGEKCEDIEIANITTISPQTFLPFDVARKAVETTFLNNKKSQIINEKIQKIQAKENLLLPYTSMVKLLQESGFTVKKHLSSNREFNTEKISNNLFTEIFKIHKSQFTKSIQSEKLHQIAFVQDVFENNKSDPEYISKSVKALHDSKIIDLYQLYYMSLQDKYDIDINKVYFAGYVQK